MMHRHAGAIRAWGTLGLGAVSLAAAACGHENSRTAHATVRDSAGVEIVESSAPVWTDGQRWRLTDTPLVDIGVVKGDPHYQLSRVTRALRLGDGRIVIASASSQDLRYYDATGEYLSTSGRRGGGPGEFKALGWVGRLSGDSLLAFDFGNRRLSLFDAAGQFVRATTVAPVGDLMFFYPIGRFADGSLAIRAERGLTRGPQFDGIFRGFAVCLHYNAQGAFLDTIGRFPAGESYVRSSSTSLLVTPVLFGRSAVSAVFDSELFYGSSEHYEVRAYASDGRLERIVRYLRPAIKVTDADVTAIKQRRLAGLPQGEASKGTTRQRIERMYANMHVAETMPAYSGLRVDPDGDLWVEDYRLPADTLPRWRVFDRHGQMLGTVTMPERFTLYEVGRDYMLGKWRDDLDVEHVRLYGLEKGQAPAAVASAQGTK